ncbi:MAG TPA: nicotinate (nicotinamide) nucleotide adenylyltransferase [Parafilimonas sp.]|nr:nicotinate (nicotinamide) nucleotide adenylyltransferase [Parafilimonas sp.]
MKVGLFFGSFNPIHTGHLIIANTVINETEITKVWFIVSPQNPLKIGADLLDADVRFQLVSMAINKDDRFEASDVEFRMSLPSYTINTVQHLETLHPENEFYLILGSDSFLNLPGWKDYSALFQKNIIVYQRPGFPLESKSYPANIAVLNSPLLEISATEIRELIKKNKSIRYLVPQPVLAEIEKNTYYR